MCGGGGRETETETERGRLLFVSTGLSLASGSGDTLPRATGPALNSRGLSPLSSGLRASALQPHKCFSVPTAAPRLDFVPPKAALSGPPEGHLIPAPGHRWRAALAAAATMALTPDGKCFENSDVTPHHHDTALRTVTDLGGAQ